MAVLLMLAQFAGAGLGASERDFGLDFPVVRSITIVGNRAFDDRTLKDRMRTKEKRFYHLIRKPKYRRDFLRRDLESLRSFYSRNGFFEARVSLEAVEHHDKSNAVRIRIAVEEGPRTVVRSLGFSRQELVAPGELRRDLLLVEGNPYNPQLVDVDRYTLYSRFFARGHLGALVTPRVEVDSIAVDVWWDLDPRIPVRVEQIHVLGNRTVDERLVRRELTIESGKYFRLSRVLDSKQNLYDTGYFSAVDIEPVGLDIERGATDLEIQLRERKKGYLETGIGVGNVHANRIFSEWGQRNLLGRGYALNLRGEYAFSLFRDNRYESGSWDPRNRFFMYRGTLAFPHVVGTRNTFTLGADYEYNAIVEPIVIRGQKYNLSLSRRFTRQMTILAGFALESIERENVPDEPPTSRRRAVDASFRRDTRNFYFNPTRGGYLSLETRVAGGLLGGGDNYWSVVPTFQRYLRAPAKAVLAYRLRFGYADPFGESRKSGIPIESRFFTGGANSVRGYRENSLGPMGAGGEPRGGRVLMLGNVELRFPLPWIDRYNFGAVVFADAGNVWSRIEEISLDRFRFATDPDDIDALSFRYSFGYGLRYYTPVGPIRIDVGHPVSRMPDGEAYRIHISLGQIF